MNKARWKCVRPGLWVKGKWNGSRNIELHAVCERSKFNRGGWHVVAWRDGFIIPEAEIEFNLPAARMWADAVNDSKVE